MRISERENSSGKKFALVFILSAILVISAMPMMAMASDWPQFQRDEVNSGWTTDPAPTAEPIKAWKNFTHGKGDESCSSGGIDVPPLVAEGKVFVIDCCADLWAFNATTGAYLWDNPLGTTCSFYLPTPTYHDGIVYVVISGITAVYANSGTIREHVDLPMGPSPLAYADSKIYAGSFNSSAETLEDSGRYYCVNASNVSDVIWESTPIHVTAGHYWAGAAVIGDYIVFGDDDAYVTCLNKSTGEYVDHVNLSEAFGTPGFAEIRSSVTWNESTGRIYFTAKWPPHDGGAFAINFNSGTGKFNAPAGWRSDISYSTSTPVVYDGKVYVGTGGMYGGVEGVRCLNEADGTILYSTAPYLVQASPALSIQNGHKYIYFTTNVNNGKAYCYEDIGTAFEERWIWDPPAPDNQYILQGVAISDGYVYFGTDYGNIYALKSSEEEKKPDLTVTAINNDTIYNGTYNIIRVTVENVGNGSAGQFNVTLNDGSGVVDTATVTGIAPGASTDVKLLWTPTTTNPYTLTVTADSGGVIDEWDEGNNSMQKSGLTPTDILSTNLTVTEVCDGDLFNDTENVVFAVIKNDGADASGFNVTLEVNAEEMDRVFVPALHFRDSQLVTFNWTPSSASINKVLNVTIEDGGYRTQTVDVVDPTIVYVDGGSIQAVIDAPGDNKKIIVNDTGSPYNEQLTIPSGKSGIRLIANGDVTIANNNQGGIITINGENCMVKGFEIIDGWDGSAYPNHPGAGINVTSEWNVIEDNYIYNTSGGIKLYGSKNLVECNTVGNSSAGRACLNLMAISGDCNAIVKNRFDGDTGHGWILGGTFTSSGITETEANDNLVRNNNFTVTGVGVETPGMLTFGGDPNLVFNNIINDTDSSKVELGRLNWYYVDKVAVENPKCGNVVHGPYYGGNYWTGYTGEDIDGDLLGDTDIPYRGYDKHPLIKVPCGDVDDDNIQKENLC
jgi:outer membrane protein assembly factor BamB